VQTPTGAPGSFTVVNNNLPGTIGVPNGITLQQAVDFQMKASEVQDQLSVTKKLYTGVGNMAFTAGAYYDQSNSSDDTPVAGFGYSTLTPQPSMLNVTLLTPDGKTLQVTNPAGYSAPTNIGAGYFGGTWKQLDLFFAHHWQYAGWILDWGLRYEADKSYAYHNSNSGTVTVSASNNLYADSYPTATDPYYAEERLHTFAYSTALTRELNDSNVVYGRFSVGKSAPGLLQYANAAVQAQNPPIPQTVTQYELGYKLHKPNYSIDITPYYSLLKQPGTSILFVYTNGDSGGFGTLAEPNPASKTSDYGVEFDGRLHFDSGFSLRTAVTWQRSKLISSYSWIQPPNFVAPSDNPYLGSTLVNTNAGNTAPNIPDVLATITPSYTKGPFLGQIQWQYVGRREANAYDAWEMPAYNQTNLTLQWSFSPNLSLTFIENNVFNQIGVTQWAQPGTAFSAPGTANYTRADVLANPNAVFSILTIPARAYFLRLNYQY
jgi:hypothetical protein